MAVNGQRAGSRRNAAITLTVVSVALLLVALIRFSGGDDEAATPDMLPSVDLVGAGESTVSTDDLIGGPLVVNFWYSACPPCANELKYFAAVERRHGDEVRFVGVNAIDTVDEMAAFAGERGVTYELLQDPLAELQTEMRLSSFPTTVFVAADGTITARTGVLDEAGLEAQVLDLLGR